MRSPTRRAATSGRRRVVGTLGLCVSLCLSGCGSNPSLDADTTLDAALDAQTDAGVDSNLWDWDADSRGVQKSPGPDVATGAC